MRDRGDKQTRKVTSKPPPTATKEAACKDRIAQQSPIQAAATLAVARSECSLFNHNFLGNMITPKLDNFIVHIVLGYRGSVYIDFSRWTRRPQELRKLSGVLT
ncbi:hypothetical protein J6590_031920 [Homalodisca vitripennis]|nr:hypothetical protein J6590_031920 [Homalodisca vitripennis]